jgi:outer membrane protein TolC
LFAALCFVLDSCQSTAPPSATPLTLPPARGTPRASDSADPPPLSNLHENLADKPAAVPPADEDYLLDLPAALRLAEAVNPTLAVSRQAIEEARAQRVEAAALLLPTLRVGSNYRRHDGVFQSAFGEMRRVNLTSLYFGGGARALAAGSVTIPMAQILAHLGDAYYEPLAARQQIAVRRNETQAVDHNILLDVATRYLDLAAAEAEGTILRQSEEEMNAIAQFAAERVEQIEASDAYRVRTEALLLHDREQSSEERRALAAAELARLLNLDPAVRLHTPSGDLEVVEIVDPDHTLNQLLEMALRFRPELAALQARLARQETRIRQERARPWLPTVSLAFSSGEFGGDTNRTDLVIYHPQFGRLGVRTDFDAIAFWTLQNAGIGNRLLQKQRVSQRNEILQQQTLLVNQIRREVADALTLSESRLRRLELDRRRLRTATRGLEGDWRRIRAGQGRFLELLTSMNFWVQARRNVLASTLAYNRAQFQLFVAVGQTPLAATPHLKTPTP